MFYYIGPRDPSFPKEFWLLQQEAILARSCILTGIEFMIKGRFDGREKGHYYTSFFQISIGIERMLKLIIITHQMLLHPAQPVSQKFIKSFGHNLVRLYQEIERINKDIGSLALQNSGEESIEKKILCFLNDFAQGTGRYHNISSLSGDNTNDIIDPIDAWDEIISQIFQDEFTEKMHSEIEKSVIEEERALAEMPGSIGGEEYIKYLRKNSIASKANNFAVLKIIEIIKPLAEILSDIVRNAPDENIRTSDNRARIPDYHKIFIFCFLDKKTILRKKRWTDAC